jgi:hypothetical protein
MASLAEIRRRAIIPLVGVGVAAYYLLVFLPLDHRAKNLDVPLDKAWQNLATSLGRPKASAIDFGSISNQLAGTREALAKLAEAKTRTLGRMEISDALGDSLNQSFQLLEYQNRRGKEVEDVSRLAAQKKVVIDPAVFAGYPEHTVETRQPELLWAALSFIDGLLRTAIQTQVGAIHYLEAPVALTNSPPFGPHWAEIPIQIEFTAAGANALRFLHALPLRTEEAQAAGYKDLPPDKPPLFIDRLVIRKQTPTKPDEVRVYVRVIGFVPRS